MKDTKKRKERPLTSYFPAKRTLDSSSSNVPRQQQAENVVVPASMLSCSSSNLESSIIPPSRTVSPDAEISATLVVLTEDSAEGSVVEDTVKRQTNSNSNNTVVEAEPSSSEPPETKVSSVVDNNKESGEPTEMNPKLYRTTKNLAHLFLRQSTTGKRMPRVFPSKWSTPSWIQFFQTTTCQKVTNLAFDAKGILLAVAHADGSLRIFDWDEHSAANLQGRRRVIQSSLKVLDPVLEFRLPFRNISLLKWNPFQQDVLAVGDR
jgi:hypothetical protein